MRCQLRISLLSWVGSRRFPWHIVDPTPVFPFYWLWACEISIRVGSRMHETAQSMRFRLPQIMRAPHDSILIFGSIHKPDWNGFDKVPRPGASPSTRRQTREWHKRRYWYNVSSPADCSKVRNPSYQQKFMLAGDINGSLTEVRRAMGDQAFDWTIHHPNPLCASPFGGSILCYTFQYFFYNLLLSTLRPLLKSNSFLSPASQLVQTLEKAQSIPTFT